jgi:hypothetical protein
VDGWPFVCYADAKQDVAEGLAGGTMMADHNQVVDRSIDFDPLT